MNRAAASARESRGASLRAAAAVLFPVGILEVLALAPRGQWLEPRVWLKQAIGIALVVAVVGVVAAALRSMAARSGRRWRTADVVAALALLVVALAHVQPLLASALGLRRLPALLALGAVAAIAFAGLRLLAVRRQLSSSEERLLLLAMLALPIGWTAVQRAVIFTPAYRSWPAATVAAAGVYLLAVAAAVGGWGGRRRLALLAVTIALALGLLRLAVPNPHELVVLPRTPGAEGRDVAGRGLPVLLIVLDTVRADALDLAGPATSRTPHLARFARDADVYSNAIANASWTLPGHASLFTGLRVSEHRTDHTDEAGFTNSLPAAVPTAQELFAGHGYRTSCVTANPVISLQTGLARGFERYRSPGKAWMYATLPLRLFDLAVAGRKNRFLQILAELSGPTVFGEADEIVDAALGEIAGDPNELYLFVNFMDAHAPFPPVSDEEVRARLSLLRDWLLVLADRGDVPASYRDTIRRRYRWRIEQMDRELGRLFEELSLRGWYDEMLIVVTADHGQAMGENPNRPYWGHHSSYETAVRVPLLIKRAGQRRGGSKAHVVQQTDVLPALLAMAALPPHDRLRSRVLDPGLELPVITEWYPSPRGRGVPFSRLGLYRDHYKLVLEANGERVFLYDLERSPYEEVDVRSLQGETAARMRAELDAVLQRSRAMAPDAPATLDPAVEEQLKALGYVN